MHLVFREILDESIKQELVDHLGRRHSGCCICKKSWPSVGTANEKMKISSCCGIVLCDDCLPNDDTHCHECHINSPIKS